MLLLLLPYLHGYELSFGTSETYYVSPDGDDGGDGSASNPWRTIQHAVNNLNPGDILIIKPGEYHEYITIERGGEEGNPITIRGEVSGEVIIDGIIEGEKSGGNGITISPNVSHIVIENLVIRNFGTWGIGVFGSNEEITLREIEIYSCEAGIRLTVGYSGEEPMHGPVEKIQIIGCNIHDNLVTGVDATPGPVYDLLVVDTIIRDNGDPQYGYGADGFAVESGNHLLFVRSMFYRNSGDGLDLCSRNPLLVSGSTDVTVRECWIFENQLSGLKLWAGGSAINNVIYGNGEFGIELTYNGEYWVINCLVAKNGYVWNAYPLTAGYPYEAAVGRQDDIRLHIYNTIFVYNGQEDSSYAGLYYGRGVHIDSDYNIYFNRDFEEIHWELPNGTVLEISREDINSGRWSHLSGNDAHSFCAGDLFVDLTGNNFHLREGSPAIDAGTSEHAPQVDAEGFLRPAGNAVDIGPFEYGSQSTTKITESTTGEEKAGRLDIFSLLPWLITIAAISVVVIYILATKVRRREELPPPP